MFLKNFFKKRKKEKALSIEIKSKKRLSKEQLQNITDIILNENDYHNIAIKISIYLNVSEVTVIISNNSILVSF